MLIAGQAATESRGICQSLGIDKTHFKVEAERQDCHSKIISVFTLQHVSFLVGIKNKTQLKIDNILELIEHGKCST